MERIKYFISCSTVMVFITITTVPTIAKSPARQAAEAFVGACFHNIDDLSRIISMAKSLNWAVPKKEFLEATKPRDGQGYQGWVLPELINHGPVFVLINRGKTGTGKAANICSVIVNVSKEEILKAFQGQLELKFIREDSQPFQRESFYRAEHPYTAGVTIQILHDGNGNPPINITVVGSK